MITATPELASKVGVSVKSLRAAVRANKFSDRLGRALEEELGFDRGTLPRAERGIAKRIPKELHAEFLKCIHRLCGPASEGGVRCAAELMETTYENATHIYNGRYLPSILHVRAIIKNNGTRSNFGIFDDPSYVFTEKRSIIGEALREARLAKGMTIENLAERLGCHHASISRFECGDRPISYENLDALVDILSAPHLIEIWNAARSADKLPPGN